MSNKDLLNKARAYCEKNGLRFTEPRAAVLKIMSLAQKPMGAYDVLEKMKSAKYHPNPPTVYRAIEFLQTHGFLHRIESLNSYITCHAGHSHNGSQFIICDGCGNAQEIHLCQIPNDLKQKIESSHFKMTHWSAEIHGVCENCSGN